jgi:hypothetical protein
MERLTMRKLTSRKFIVTLASIAGVLATPGLGKTEKAIIAGLALVYLVVEGVLDLKGLPAKDAPSSITNVTNANAPPSLTPVDLKAIADAVGQVVFGSLNATSSGDASKTSEAPKTLPGVGEERRNV